jgi:hypothetical protein
MPRGDQSGPNGQGSMTGRGLGVCNNSNTQFVGRGRGRGLGRGLGNGNFNSNVGNPIITPSIEDEKAMLQNRLDVLNNQSKK